MCIFDYVIACTESAVLPHMLTFMSHGPHSVYIWKNWLLNFNTDDDAVLLCFCKRAYIKHLFFNFFLKFFFLPPLLCWCRYNLLWLRSWIFDNHDFYFLSIELRRMSTGSRLLDLLILLSNLVRFTFSNLHKSTYVHSFSISCLRTHTRVTYAGAI